MKVSIVIPCFNEERTLRLLLERAASAPSADFAKQFIIVDDGSSDRSAQIAEQFARENPVEVVVHRLGTNQGKGAAVRKGFELAQGDVVLVQDADLEYDPNDYPKLLRLFRENPKIQVVYGSRIMGSGNRSYTHYYWGGRAITFFTNLLYGSKLTDEPTGYKAFRRKFLQSIPLESNGFEFCPEVTARVLRRGVRIVETPISYHPRNFSEGKKISWRDGITALWTLLKWRWGAK